MVTLQRMMHWFSMRGSTAPQTSFSNPLTAKPLTARKLAGNKGEEHAVRLLKKRGDTLVARNWSCKSGELDLVTWHKDTLVFVEVRTRASSDFGTPAESVDRKKQEKVRRTAQAFIAARFRDGRLPSWRFDIVWVIAKDDAITDSGIIPNAFI